MIDHSTLEVRHSTFVSPMRVEAHRGRLLAVKRGALPWPDCPSPIGWERVPEAGEGSGIAWPQELDRDFERALAETKLPERPDYEAANRLLVKARRKPEDRHRGKETRTNAAADMRTL
jgi:hypothetical protein